MVLYSGSATGFPNRSPLRPPPKSQVGNSAGKTRPHTSRPFHPAPIPAPDRKGVAFVVSKRLFLGCQRKNCGRLLPSGPVRCRSSHGFSRATKIVRDIEFCPASTSAHSRPCASGSRPAIPPGCSAADNEDVYELRGSFLICILSLVFRVRAPLEFIQKRVAMPAELRHSPSRVL